MICMHAAVRGARAGLGSISIEVPCISKVFSCALISGEKNSAQVSEVSGKVEVEPQQWAQSGAAVWLGVQAERLWKALSSPRFPCPELGAGVRVGDCQGFQKLLEIAEANRCRNRGGGGRSPRIQQPVHAWTECGVCTQHTFYFFLGRRETLTRAATRMNLGVMLRGISQSQRDT